MAQINISDRGAMLLLVGGALGGAVAFAPDMVSEALQMLAGVIPS
jgi:hypothetical protein